MDDSFWLVFMLAMSTSGVSFTTTTNTANSTSTAILLSASSSVSSALISYEGTTVTLVGYTVTPEGTTVTSEGTTVTSVDTAGTSVGTTVTSLGTTVTPEGTTVTSEGTTVTPVDTTVTSVGTTVTPVGTTVTPVGTTVTSVGTTVTPEGTTVTSVGTTVTPEGTTVTSVGTTVTSVGTTVTPEGTTITSVGTTVTPQGTTVTSVGTTVTPEGTTVTSVGTTVTPEGTTITSVGTTVTPEGTTVTSVDTTVTSVDTTVTPEGTTVTSVGTTVTPEGTTVTSVDTTVTSVDTTVTSVGTVTSVDTTVTSVGTTVTPEGTVTSVDTTVTPEGTTFTPEGTTVTSVDTTVTPEGTTVTSVDTTVTPEGTTATPEGTTATPEGTTVTPVDTAGTSVATTVTSEGTTSTSVGTTVTPVGTTVTPEGTTVTSVDTTVTPEGTTVTSVDTTVTPEGTTATPEGTTATPEGTTATPEGTTVTPVDTAGTSVATTVTSEGTTGTSVGTTVTPEGTTVTPVDTTVTPEGTTVTSVGTTVTPEGTTVTPEGTTVTSVGTTATPEGTTVTPVDTAGTSVGTTVTSEGTTGTSVSTTVTSVDTAGTSVGTTVTSVGTTNSTSSTTSPPSTTAPLQCENGGILLNGVCICPDEWSGETCSTGNTCNATELDGYEFPITPIGWFAYSEKKCPQGTSAAGKPMASTRCSTTDDGSVQFSPPQVLQCDRTLSDIQQNLTNAEDLETLASSTQILTSRPEELTAEEVTTAAQIINTLLLSPNATESVRVAAVTTVSQLLNTSKQDNTEGNEETQRLTKTLDQLSLNLSSSQSQVVQPNLVVQSAQILRDDSQGVQFTSLRGTSGSFVANRIRLNTNTSEVVSENGFISEALIHVRFPSGKGSNARLKQSNVSLGFVLYQNDRFFPSMVYRKTRATIRVLSGSVSGAWAPPHVEMRFQPALPNGSFLHDFSCVFWDYNLKDWSPEGCSKGNYSDGVLTCFCNHTTNFAALWSFRETYEYAEALDVISIIGLSFSILGLVVTIIHHIQENFYRRSRERRSNLNSKLALLSIYVSLLAFIITFLSGVQNSNQQNGPEVERSRQNHILDSDVHVEPDSGSCTAVAALLHFFLLATFTWNSVYGTQLVLLVRSMRRSLPPHWTPLSVGVGWGFPAVVMVIALAATYRMDDPLGYRQEEFCWLAALDASKRFNFGKPMFWAFLLPVGLILIYNMVLLVLTSMTTCRVDPNLTSTSHSSLTKKFLVSFSLAVMLGVSWTLGYLVLVTSGTAHQVFSILFCLCTTTQGFQIFILFTARTPSFRAGMRRSVQYVSSVSVPLKQTKYNLRKTERGTTISETYREIRDRETGL